MYKYIKPIFFKFEPEQIHHFVMKQLHWVYHKLPFGKAILKKCFSHEGPERELWGIRFKNPVGLAAGFDKNAEYIEELDSLGFGFIEVGTVTPKAQPGNEQPRMFRLQDDHALINRMGFNNKGVEVMRAKLQTIKKKRPDIVIGGNIGKNKITPNEDAVQDYLICFAALHDIVDYFVVNVSSPNTPDLRALQDKEPLMQLLQSLQNENQKLDKPKPILLKIAPDLNESQLDDIIDIVQQTQTAGVIASNTTISRAHLQSDEKLKSEAGGLSGQPFTHRSTEVIKYLSQKSNQAFPIIGVGGIHSAKDAQEKIDAGASLVQLYTGFVYEGPSLIQKICKQIQLK